MELVFRTISIGVGATLLLDLWAQILKRFLGVRGPNLAMLGRWVGNMPRGRFVHQSVAKAPSVQGEAAIGWIVHYVIGILFAGMLVAIQGADWVRQPTFFPALVFGIVTVAIPFFVMHPSVGAGIAASRTPDPNRARFQSILGHTVFGIGLYLSAMVLALAD
jgi:hypothetical protein